MIFVYLLVFLLVALLFWDFWKKRVSFYKSLGAEEIQIKFLLNPVGKIDLDGIRMDIFTEGAKSNQRLTLRAKTNLTGFLKLYKRSIWNRLFSQEIFGGLGAEYEDERWFNRVINYKNFRELVEKLFQEGQVNEVRIEKDKLSLSWKIRNHPREGDREKVLKALPIMKEFLSLLSKLPDATHYREHVRSWMSIKLPVVITVVLCAVGIVGGFYRYDPVCSLEIFGVGFKLLLPSAFLYALVGMLLAGSFRLGFRVLVYSLTAWLLAIPFISLFFLMYINGKLDRSLPEVKTDKVVEKYTSTGKGGSVKYRIVLAHLHSQKDWCDHLQVSKKFYERVQVGDTVEYITKRGFLGVEWYYQKLSIKVDGN
ncbi:hypothetical protein Hydth_0684 [Hydrogenobacter thermophilus TK-6]|uniref:Uncharacterized protein n=1 Tax=Hydrogenobacter thermophilus (strain DSM 6534 / IAM 12695 / TK-6) TaxID=608538 RepID=D3DH43_HYDTT|nr:hypothetical protein [Hydrogenobacter thermophilus]ADO45082.1 hypothetical protein Hydth_0684 [Hydrogenobacter thermophilus TK-6]BAI69145.1 hypothetical protein HTH_0685 [Hydrogenobacter thermophilus TK-6]